MYWSSCTQGQIHQVSTGLPSVCPSLYRIHLGLGSRSLSSMFVCVCCTRDVQENTRRRPKDEKYCRKKRDLQQGNTLCHPLSSYRKRHNIEETCAVSWGWGSCSLSEVQFRLKPALRWWRRVVKGTDQCVRRFNRNQNTVIEVNRRKTAFTKSHLARQLHNQVTKGVSVFTRPSLLICIIHSCLNSYVLLNVFLSPLFIALAFWCMTCAV